MTISIELSPDEEQRLVQEASRRGLDAAEYARELLRKHLRLPGTLDELLAPVREDFRASGMTEDELDALVEEAREEVRHERHGTSGRGT